MRVCGRTGCLYGNYRYNGEDAWITNILHIIDLDYEHRMVDDRLSRHVMDKQKVKVDLIIFFSNWSSDNKSLFNMILIRINLMQWDRHVCRIVR
jgi:hypothetical protein